MKLIDTAKGVGRWVWENTEFLAKWAQILALMVAGYWAYTRFLIGAKPTLEPRVSLAIDLKDEIPGPTADTCYLYLDFKLTNDGIASFDTHGAEIKAWRSPLEAVSSVDGSYVDPAQFERGKQVVDLHNRDLLTMHFAPGESAARTYTWVFHSQPTAVYFFTVDTEAYSGSSIKHIHAQTWSQTLCVNKSSRSNRDITRSR